MLPPAPTEGKQQKLAYRAASEAVAAANVGNWNEASARLRDAVARAPAPAYFFDLCVTLCNEGKLDESVVSCNGGMRIDPDATLHERLDRMLARIQRDRQP